MAKQYKYRVWCVTEVTHVVTPGFSSSAPTQCPNNPAHTIDAAKTARIDSNLTLDGHSVDTANPHSVTSIQAGSSNIRSEILIKDDSNPWIKNNSSSYQTMGVFRFGGTTGEGTPTAIYLVGYVSDAAYIADMRIQDITNSKTVAETTGMTWTVKNVDEIKSITVVPANLPSGAAVFEIQGRKNAVSGGGELRAREVSLKY